MRRFLLVLILPLLAVIAVVLAVLSLYEATSQSGERLTNTPPEEGGGATTRSSRAPALRLAGVSSTSRAA